RLQPAHRELGGRGHRPHPKPTGVLLRVALQERGRHLDCGESEAQPECAPPSGGCTPPQRWCDSLCECGFCTTNCISWDYFSGNCNVCQRSCCGETEIVSC